MKNITVNGIELKDNKNVNLFVDANPMITENIFVLENKETDGQKRFNIDYNNRHKHIEIELDGYRILVKTYIDIDTKRPQVFININDSE